MRALPILKLSKCPSRYLRDSDCWTSWNLFQAASLRLDLDRGNWYLKRHLTQELLFRASCGAIAVSPSMACRLMRLQILRHQGPMTKEETLRAKTRTEQLDDTVSLAAAIIHQCTYIFRS